MSVQSTMKDCWSWTLISNNECHASVYLLESWSNVVGIEARKTKSNLPKQSYLCAMMLHIDESLLCEYETVL